MLVRADPRWEGIPPEEAAICSKRIEFPFLSYVEEPGGPLGLAARGEVAVYTGGIANAIALLDALLDCGVNVEQERY